MKRTGQNAKKGFLLAFILVGAILAAGQNQCNVPIGDLIPGHELAKFQCTAVSETDLVDFYGSFLLTFYDNQVVSMKVGQDLPKFYNYYYGNNGAIYFNKNTGLLATTFEIYLDPSGSSLVTATGLYGNSTNFFGQIPFSGVRVN